MNLPSPVIIATRGSALAMAQARLILGRCRELYPAMAFEIKIFKTTGDRLQGASLTKAGGTLPKGLFTKELEVALLEGQADLAVHSLKDLPTELPEGLMLAATPEREDVRDVLIYRAETQARPGLKAGINLSGFPAGATVATSSTRRKCQIHAARPDLNVVEIRGNLATRLKKIAESETLSATLLAKAGISRLGWVIGPDGFLAGDGVPAGLQATCLDLEVMLPCVGQGAIGLEIRCNDPRMEQVCAALNHAPTFHSITAERSLLRSMGGGCLSPLAAHGHVQGQDILLRAVYFRDGHCRKASGRRAVLEAEALGLELSHPLKATE